jgi:hypothetical protein
MRNVADLAVGQAASGRLVAVRRATVMATLAAGVAAYPVAGAAPDPPDGMAVSGGSVPAGRGAGAGGFLVIGSPMQLLPPVRTPIDSFTTAPITIPITTRITGFHTPTRTHLRHDAER